MKRTALCAVALGIVVAVTGCNFVMAPEASDERAGVSFVIMSLAPTGEGSVPRAVVQGSGYLYIRTIGGPTGDKGPVYGPYTVTSGETFKTKDIPPGDFDQILIMHSGKQLFTDATYDVEGKQMTFKQIMSMKDTDMIEFMAENEDGDDSTSRFKAAKDALGTAFDGQACMGVVTKVTLRADKTTTLTVTLMPITDQSRDISLEESARFAFPKSDSLARSFYRLEGLRELTVPVTTGFLECKIRALSSGASVGAVAFYDESGNLVPSTKTGTSVTDGLLWRIDAAGTNAALRGSELRLYMYVEYTGEIASDFVATMPPYVTFGFKGDGVTALKSKRILMGIYGDATRDSLATGGSWATQMPVGTAILDLDANGNGLGILKVGVEAGKNYYFSAQIDVGGRYASLTNFGSVDVSTIIPYAGDYVSKGDPALEAINVHGLSPFKVGEMVVTNSSSFDPYGNPVFFVSSTGSGSNDGLTPSASKALDATFLAAVPNGAQIYVLDTINGVPSFTISNKNVSIKSYGKVPFQLNADLAGTGNMFVISMNGSLAFEDIELNATNVAAVSSPIISISGSLGSPGSLYMGPRSSIWGKNSGTASPTGGVYMMAYTSLTMFGSGIYQCKGSLGGALYLMGTTSTADLRYSTFRFNVDGGTTGNAVIVNQGQVTAKALTITDNTGNPPVNTPYTILPGTWYNAP